MRAVLQRVKMAKVTIGNEAISEIGRGILVFLGVEKEDSPADASYLASKIFSLRIFADDSGKFNLSAPEVEADILVVSQFTLFGDCRKGKRPSFDRAASPELAKRLYQLFIAELKNKGAHVAQGEFQAKMEVSLVNDGPVTILLDSKKLF